MALHFTPYQAVPLDANDRYDLASDAGNELYKKSTRSLYPKGEYYDCEQDEMFTLIALLGNRAEEVNWSQDPDGIMWIPDDIENIENAENENILEAYGSISMDRIQDWEGFMVVQSDYLIQQDFMLHQCLMNTLSLRSKAKVQAKQDQYIRDSHRHGLSLLKVILGESHLDTNATTSALRTQITQLHEYIHEVNCDISMFNKYVQRLLDGLSSRKQRSEDVLTNLFKAYLAVNDEDFVQYVKRKESEYEDGVEMTPQSLMKSADNKYKVLVLKKTWRAPSQLETEVIALKAELKRSKKGPGNDRSGTKTKKGGKQQGPKAKPNWLEKNHPPKQENLTQARQWSNLDWHWCHKDTGGKCDGRWVRHTPKQCMGYKRKEQKVDGGSEKKKPKKQVSLKLQKAYAAVAAAEADKESSSDSE